MKKHTLHKQGNINNDENPRKAWHMTCFCMGLISKKQNFHTQNLSAHPTSQADNDLLEHIYPLAMLSPDWIINSSATCKSSEELGCWHAEKLHNFQKLNNPQNDNWTCQVRTWPRIYSDMWPKGKSVHVDATAPGRAEEMDIIIYAPHGGKKWMLYTSSQCHHTQVFFH